MAGFMNIFKMRPYRPCEICGWPMADVPDKGCVPGNCSYRPIYGSMEWRRIEDRKRELADPIQGWCMAL